MKKILLMLMMLLPLNIYALEEESSYATEATSAIMIEASTGEILFEKNSKEKLPPASMTKIMTMLIIMQKIEDGSISWKDNVTASKYASSMGGSQIFLEEGEVMSVRDLVKGIAIASGNDAAVAMAEYVAGSEEEFVKLMNNKVKQLGLTSTNFKNVTGLEAENHYSSAYDMSIMAKELVKHEEILKYTGTYDDYLREGQENKLWLVNTNKLVRFYNGVDGLKTGYTNEAGYCLTATANKNNMRLITVVMNEPSAQIRNSETTALLNYGYSKYKINNVVKTSDVIGKVKVLMGSSDMVSIVPKENVNILSKSNEKVDNISYKTKIDQVTAPIKKGQKIGHLTILNDGTKIKTIDLTVNKDIPKAGLFKIYLRNIINVISGNIVFIK